MRQRRLVLAVSAAAAMVAVTPVAALASGHAGGTSAEQAGGNPHAFKYAARTGSSPDAFKYAARASSPDAFKYGSTSVSLSGWNRVIPVDSSGGTSGDAVTVSPAKPYSPWLTATSSGALNFWAPSDGARLGPV